MDLLFFSSALGLDYRSHRHTIGQRLVGDDLVDIGNTDGGLNHVWGDAGDQTSSGGGRGGFLSHFWKSRQAVVPGERTRTCNRNFQRRHVRWASIFSSAGSLVVVERRLAGFVYADRIRRLYMGHSVAEIFPRPFRVFVAAGGRAKIHFGSNRFTSETRCSTEGQLASPD